MISGVSHGNGFGGAVSYVTEKDDATVLDLRGVMSERTAAAEMRAIAAQSERVQKPVYHRWFRVAEGERLTDEQWLAVVDKAEAAIGLEGHQRVVVRHGEDHVHVVWNRVNPESGKAQRVSHDFPKVEQVCRSAEQEYGLSVVAGHHSWKQAGAEHPPAAREATPAEQRQEDRTGREPFARIVADTGAQAFREARSWGDLSDRLERAGLTLQAYRQGLTVTDGTERAGVSAITGNEWTRAKLEKRFGQTWADFQADQERGASTPAVTPAATPAAPLRQRQERPDAERLRQRYQDDCRQQRSTLNRLNRKNSFDAAWRGEQSKRAQEAAARRQDVQQRKALARTVLGRGLARTLAYKAIDSRNAKRMREDRAQAKQRWEATKAQLSAAPRPDHRPMEFKAWVAEQARQGDEAARRQLAVIDRKTAQPAAATPAAQVQARQDRALPEPQVETEWKRLVAARTASLSDRAEAMLKDTMGKRQDADRYLDEVRKQQPAEPRGLAALVPGAQGRYEAAVRDWRTEIGRVEKGRNDLWSHEDKLKAFLGKTSNTGNVDTLHERANREVREERPELAKRMDTIRERREAERRQEVEQRRQANLERFSKKVEQERGTSQGKGRGGIS